MTECGVSFSCFIILARNEALDMAHELGEELDVSAHYFLYVLCCFCLLELQYVYSKLAVGPTATWVRP